VGAAGNWPFYHDCDLIDMEGFKEHWKIYIPSWVFPFIVIANVFYEDSTGKESLLINLFLSICFFTANFCVMNPYLKGNVKLSEAVVFWALTPFLVWVLLVQFRLMHGST